MENFEVTVIVPVYNTEMYLRQCLDSLVCQDNIEIICVNDGSTDGSLAILREYESKYSNIRVLDQPDLGLGAAFNRALRLSHGKYVAECDSDDWVEPDMYHTLYHIAEVSEADAVKCSVFNEYEDGRPAEIIKQCEDFYLDKPLRISHMIEAKYPLVFARTPMFFAGIYRRKYLLENGINYREGKNFEDTSLTPKILSGADPFVFASKALYHYRVSRPGSGTATINDPFAICEQFDELIRWSRDRGYNAEDCINTSRFYVYMWNLSRLSDQQKSSFMQRMTSDFNENPAPPYYFNCEEDWQMYRAIRGGYYGS